MKLKLKENATIPEDKYGVEHPEAVINGCDIHLDKKFNLTITIALYHSIEDIEEEEINELTWVFSRQPVPPRYTTIIDDDGNETQGEMYYTGHSGAIAIYNKLSILPLGDNPFLVSPKTEDAKAWILAQKDWNGVPISDNWEYFD